MERRDIAEAYMRSQVTLLWRAQENISYTLNNVEKLEGRYGEVR